MDAQSAPSNVTSRSYTAEPPERVSTILQNMLKKQEEKLPKLFKKLSELESEVNEQTKVDLCNRNVDSLKDDLKFKIATTKLKIELQRTLIYSIDTEINLKKKIEEINLNVNQKLFESEKQISLKEENVNRVLKEKAELDSIIEKQKNLMVQQNEQIDILTKELSDLKNAYQLLNPIKNSSIPSQDNIDVINKAFDLCGYIEKKLKTELYFALTTSGNDPHSIKTHLDNYSAKSLELDVKINQELEPLFLAGLRLLSSSTRSGPIIHEHAQERINQTKLRESLIKKWSDLNLDFYEELTIVIKLNKYKNETAVLTTAVNKLITEIQIEISILDKIPNSTYVITKTLGYQYLDFEKLTKFDKAMKEKNSQLTIFRNTAKATHEILTQLIKNSLIPNDNSFPMLLGFNLESQTQANCSRFNKINTDLNTEVKSINASLLLLFGNLQKIYNDMHLKLVIYEKAAESATGYISPSVVVDEARALALNLS